jgi:hypothetical protein
VLSGMTGHSMKPCHICRSPLIYSYNDLFRDVVVKAWNLAMVLAKEAISSLEAVQPGSPNYQLFESQTVVVDGICKAMKTDQTRMTSQYLLCYRSFIAARNLAYGQLFGADPEGIGSSKSQKLFVG